MVQAVGMQISREDVVFGRRSSGWDDEFRITDDSAVRDAELLCMSREGCVPEGMCCN